MKMRVLIATFTFAPERNGVANVVYAHAKGLAALGHHVTVVTCPNPHRESSSLVPEGIQVREIQVGGWRRYHGESEKYCEFLRSFPADVFMFHCWQTWTTDLALPVLKDIDAKKVLVSHGVSANMLHSWRDLSRWILWRPYVWRMAESMKLFDRVVFLAERRDRDRFLDRYLVMKHGMTNDIVIPNGANLEDQHPGYSFKEKFGVPTRFLVLNVSEFSPLKNQERTIRVFLQSGRRDATLLFMGTKENLYSRHLNGVIDRLGARDKVRIMVNPDREAMRAAYASADLFLYTSKTDVQPLVILDAMKNGLPFVATPVGCIADLPGGVCASRDGKLASLVNRLLSSKAERDALGRAGRIACEEVYNWPRVVRRYDEMITHLVQKHSSKPA